MKSLLYHGFGIKGYRYRRTRYEKGGDHFRVGARRASGSAAGAEADAETSDSFLDALVKRRNEASHGNVEELASTNEIANYCDFVAIIIERLASILRKEIVSCAISGGNATILGRVRHVYSHNIVGVKAEAIGSIRVGETVYAGKKSLDAVSIVSLRIQQEAHASIDLAPDLELGIGLDKPLCLGSLLYKCKIV